MKLRSSFFPHSARPRSPPRPSLTIDAGKAAAKSSPLLYGLMTRKSTTATTAASTPNSCKIAPSSTMRNQPVHWAAVGGATIALDPKQPLNSAIPTSLRVEISAGGGASRTRATGASRSSPTRVIERASSRRPRRASRGRSPSRSKTRTARPFTRGRDAKLTTGWQVYDLTLTTVKDAKPNHAGAARAHSLAVGTVWLGLVSLFPPTWKDRPNGLRRDLMQLLVDLKPAFCASPAATTSRATRSNSASIGRRRSVRCRSAPAIAAHGAIVRRMAWVSSSSSNGARTWAPSPCSRSMTDIR